MKEGLYIGPSGKLILVEISHMDNAYVWIGTVDLAGRDEVPNVIGGFHLREEGARILLKGYELVVSHTERDI